MNTLVWKGCLYPSHRIDRNFQEQIKVFQYDLLLTHIGDSLTDNIKTETIKKVETLERYDIESGI